MIQGGCLCGEVRWELDGTPDGATICNCTACRRYGALWAYGHENVDIRVSGSTRAFVRGDQFLGFHFCVDCGCVAYWRSRHENEAGQRRIAVNLRLAEPADVAQIPIDRFEGLVAWEDLPRDGRCVADYWF